MRREIQSRMITCCGVVTLAVAALVAGAGGNFGAAQQKETAEALREQARAAVARTSGEWKVAGLKQPVEIIRDAWGVAHIYANTQEDLFFAQGFVAAQDRLWQLDLWRRKAMGELAEVLGPEAVERDRYARLLRYRGDWEAEWKSYAPDTKQIVESFVRGINAYIATLGDNLPVEFKLTGTRPEEWTPEVVASRMAAYPMTGNASREMLRAQVVHKLGAERTALLFPTDPARVARADDGLSLEGIDGSVLAGLERAAGEVSFDGAAGFTRSAPAEGKEISDLKFEIAEGSNNWTIAGGRTKSRKPLLANDPHRALLLPSLRYIVHLVGPGWEVIGAGEPALPGVSIGHNQRIAFGLTIFAADQQDIVAEVTHPDDPNQWRGWMRRIGWQPMKVIEEEIQVRGEAAPRRVQLKFTDHGPVIYEDVKRHRAYVLRWVGTQPGTAGYLAALAISRARNWTEFRKALERWKLPPENFVYADVDGNIGYQAAALVPARTCDGLLPTRGDSTTCDWRGFLKLDDLPHEFNPARKFAATANHNTLPAGEKKLIGFEWSTAYRFLRICEVLEQTKEHTVADSARLQADVTSLPARELLPLVGEITGAGKRGQAADLLKKWDARMEKDSAAAAIFEAWLEKLRDAVYRPLVPDEVWRVARRMISVRTLNRALREADPAFFPEGDVKAWRNRALETALDEAIAELEKRLGPDMTKWRWGALHTATFVHPLASGRASGRDATFNRGPVERGGDGNTVNATSGANYRQSSGASYRQVMDLSNWDNSLASNVPGQSGQPESAHYDDLLKLWAGDAHFPLVYTRAAVEKNAKARMKLLPATR